MSRVPGLHLPRHLAHEAVQCADQGSSSQRLRALRAVKASGGVLLTSYAIAKNEDEKLALATDVKPWDLAPRLAFL